ncbi:MAG: hypothetical protein V3573_05075 [Desulfovibrionaceae bacterium]
MAVPVELRNGAARISSAFSGGILGGLAAAGVAYWLCGLLLERHTGLDAAIWPGWDWARELAEQGAMAGALLLPPWLKRSATLKGLTLSLLPTSLMLVGLLPHTFDAPAPLPDNLTLEAALVGAGNAAWALIACWWMKLCGQT